MCISDLSHGRFSKDGRAQLWMDVRTIPKRDGDGLCID